jgi:hypothetical protein
MRPSTKQLLRCVTGGLVALLFAAGWLVQPARTQARKTIATGEDFDQAMKELSNWGRWGQDDELGAANLITPAKRKQAAGLGAVRKQVLDVAV